MTRGTTTCYTCMMGKHTKKVAHSSKYLLSTTLLSSSLVPAIFKANWPNTAPVGTRRAIAVIAGATAPDDLNDVCEN